MLVRFVVHVPILGANRKEFLGGDERENRRPWRILTTYGR